MCVFRYNMYHTTSSIIFDFKPTAMHDTTTSRRRAKTPIASAEDQEPRDGLAGLPS